MRPEALRQVLIEDGHAPAQYRALTVRNLDPWYAAFPIKETEKLYLTPRSRFDLVMRFFWPPLRHVNREDAFMSQASRRGCETRPNWRSARVMAAYSSI